MGTSDIFVDGNGSPVCVAQPFSKGIVITNTGVVNVYLDDQTSVSPTVNDYVLRPKTSVTWQPNTYCYATADPGFIGRVSISNNIQQFSSGAGLSGAANTSADVLVSGTFAEALSVPYLDVSAYTSVRIAIYPATAVANRCLLQNNGGFPPVLNVAWSPISNDYPDPLFNVSKYDNYTYRPNIAGFPEWFGTQIVLDVADKFILFGRYLQNFRNTYVDPTTIPYLDAYIVVVTGYASKRPALAFELGSEIEDRVSFQTVTALAVGSDMPDYYLPLWTGRIRIEWSEVYNAAPTTRGRWAVVEYNNQTNLAAFNAGEGYANVPTRAWHGVLDFPGGHTYKRIRWQTGAGGYATVSLYMLVTFYGNEDS